VVVASFFLVVVDAVVVLVEVTWEEGVQLVRREESICCERLALF
jgi:hypothetical protein